MKKLVIFLLLSLLFITTQAATYYVAPTGSDNNNGSILTPFKSIEKLNSLLLAGDIAYFRGGTYHTSATASSSVFFLIQNLDGTNFAPITIQNYLGELPVLSMDNITPTYANPTGVYINNCSYLHFKGFHITYLRQVANGGGVSRGLTLWNTQHSTIELVEIDNIGGSGMTIESQSNDNLIYRCDSHNNGDGLSLNNAGQPNPWDNSDGFQCSTGGDLSTRNTYRECRAWFNADDGWDKFNSNAEVHYENCRSFWNGVKPWGPTNTQVTPSQMTSNVYTTWHGNASYAASSGEGFKLGPANTQNFNLLTTFVRNCVSFENRGTGYASNSLSSLTNKHQLYNNIAYKNDNDGFSYGAGWSVGASQIFSNNWSYLNNQVISGANFVYDGNNNSGIVTNCWMNWYNGINYGNLYPTIQVSNADFLSISSVGMDGLRQADGSLPVSNFLHLSPTSDLVDKGTNVGLPYNGLAPDLGAFETNPNPLPISLITKADVVSNKTTHTITIRYIINGLYKTFSYKY